MTSGSTGGFGILALGEQIDYSDYRDVSGVKEPFTVKHSTWNAVTTEKFTDVKINAPVNDSIFAKPAPSSNGVGMGVMSLPSHPRRAPRPSRPSIP